MKTTNNKTVSVRNFKNLSRHLSKFEDEFLREGEYIDAISFIDAFNFKDKRFLTWGTESISKIETSISNDELYGNRIYKNIGDGIPKWKLTRESITYRDED